MEEAKEGKNEEQKRKEGHRKQNLQLEDYFTTEKMKIITQSGNYFKK